LLPMAAIRTAGADQSIDTAAESGIAATTSEQTPDLPTG
jgi:hypothetical protein